MLALIGVSLLHDEAWNVALQVKLDHVASLGLGGVTLERFESPPANRSRSSDDAFLFWDEAWSVSIKS